LAQQRLYLRPDLQAGDPRTADFATIADTHPDSLQEPALRTGDKLNGLIGVVEGLIRRE
jgi:hypothetical protein